VPAESASSRRDRVIYCQYRHDRARRTLCGIDEQVTKVEKVWVPKTSSASGDQAVFVNQATGASVSSDAVLT
jgi:hypothetical protein